MEFATPEDMKELRGMLSELLNLDEGLTEWEIEFCENLHNWNGEFTERQAETLENIYRKRT